MQLLEWLPGAGGLCSSAEESGFSTSLAWPGVLRRLMEPHFLACTQARLVLCQTTCQRGCQGSWPGSHSSVVHQTRTERQTGHPAAPSPLSPPSLHLWRVGSAGQSSASPEPVAGVMQLSQDAFPHLLGAVQQTALPCCTQRDHANSVQLLTAAACWLHLNRCCTLRAAVAGVCAQAAFRRSPRARGSASACLLGATAKCCF